jgi:hypothetical protein
LQQKNLTIHPLPAARRFPLPASFNRRRKCVRVRILSDFIFLSFFIYLDLHMMLVDVGWLGNRTNDDDDVRVSSLLGWSIKFMPFVKRLLHFLLLCLILMAFGTEGRNEYTHLFSCILLTNCEHCFISFVIWILCPKVMLFLSLSYHFLTSSLMKRGIIRLFFTVETVILVKTSNIFHFLPLKKFQIPKIYLSFITLHRKPLYIWISFFMYCPFIITYHLSLEN